MHIFRTTLLFMICSLAATLASASDDYKDDSCESGNNQSQNSDETGEYNYGIGLCYINNSHQIEINEKYDEYIEKIVKSARHRYLMYEQYPSTKDSRWSSDKLSDETLRSEFYLRKAAEKGHIDAQYQLGKTLLVINLTKRKIAKRWVLEKLIIKDHPELARGSWFNPGLRFSIKENYGLSREKYMEYVEQVNSSNYVDEVDPEVAFWFRSAAENGHIKAQFSMGVLAINGVARTIDSVESYAWYMVAVAQNPPFGSNRRDRLEDLLTVEEVNAGTGLGRKYMRSYSDLFKRSSQTLIR